MAKESLREYLNRKIKSKDSSLAKEKKKGSKYKSISAAKKAGALYYTNKDGKIMAAVYAEDLKEKPKEKLGTGPVEKITVSNLNEGGRGSGVNELMERNAKATKEKREREKKARELEKNKKKPKRGVDPLNLAGPKTGAAKGGMMTKKSTGYNKGGMPMVMKNGKKVPAYAADGVGKMNMGGMAKKKPAAKMMAGGMSKKSGYMYGGMAKKKPAAKKK